MLIPAIVVSNTCSKVPAYLDTSVDVPDDNQYSNTKYIIKTNFVANSLLADIITHGALYKEPFCKKLSYRMQKYLKNLDENSQTAS